MSHISDLRAMREQVEAASPKGILPGLRPHKAHCVHDELLADGSMVLYNACREQIMTINATAALAWDYCDGSRDVAAVVALVREDLPEGGDHDGDIRALLDHLYDSGMLAVIGGQD